MNILYINTTDGEGGATRLARNIKKGVEESGHKTSMFVKIKYSNDPTVFLIKKENKFFKKLSSFIGKDLNSVIYNKIHDYLSNDIEFFNNDNLLYSQELKEADIVHCHNLHNNYFNLKLLEKISKIKPVIWSLHDMWAFTPHEAWIIKDNNGVEKFNVQVKPSLYINNREYLFKKKKKIYNNSRLNIVATSGWFMDELKNSILKKQPMHLIYNGIDENIFKPTDKILARKKLNLPPKKIITFMANAGRLNRQKGWPYALKVIEHYSNNKNVLFLCLGGNKKDSNLSSENIRYIEYEKDESIFSLYYSASDIFLNPSSAEAFCLVIAQAMACGTPIVTFPVGIVNEAIIHKTSGYIAKYQDTEDLIKGVDYILNLNEQEIKKMGEISRKKVIENFTFKKMIENYLKLYVKLLNK